MSVTTIQHFSACHITSLAFWSSCLSCDIIIQPPECAGSWRLVSRVSIYVGTNPLVSQVLKSPGLHAHASRVDFAWWPCSIASHDSAGHFRCVALLATSDPMQPGDGRHPDGKETEPAVLFLKTTRPPFLLAPGTASSLFPTTWHEQVLPAGGHRDRYPRNADQHLGRNWLAVVALVTQGTNDKMHECPTRPYRLVNTRLQRIAPGGGCPSRSETWRRQKQKLGSVPKPGFLCLS